MAIELDDIASKRRDEMINRERVAALISRISNHDDMKYTLPDGIALGHYKIKKIGKNIGESLDLITEHLIKDFPTT